MTVSATQSDSDEPETDSEELAYESDSSDASTVILPERDSEPVVVQEVKRPRLG